MLQRVACILALVVFSGFDHKVAPRGPGAERGGVAVPASIT